MSVDILEQTNAEDLCRAIKTPFSRRACTASKLAG
jgi:hypothetical protein